MAARRVTAVTVPVDVRSLVALEVYPVRTPLLTIMAPRPALLVTLTRPTLESGHVRFARNLADYAASTPSRSSGPGAACRLSTRARRDCDGPGR